MAAAEEKAAEGLKQVTLSNVHTLSTYELRQELVRRNELHLKEGDPVNYRILLKMLVEVLTREEQQRQLEHARSVEETRAAERERLKALREERKREALERSKLRQEDPNYFAARAAAPLAKPITTEAEAERTAAAEETAEQAEEEEEQTTRQQDDDPFRTTSSKFKVFVR